MQEVYPSAASNNLPKAVKLLLYRLTGIDRREKIKLEAEKKKGSKLCAVYIPPA